MNRTNAKSFRESYIYSKSDYDSIIYEIMMKYPRVDKTDDNFKDIIYSVKKRQKSSAIVNVLNNNNIILVSQPAKPAPKSFKAFAGRDARNDNAIKIFIDISDIIRNDNGEWVVYTQNGIDVFISRILSAMTNYLYVMDPRRLINNSSLTANGTEAYARLFTNIMDLLYKVSVDEQMKAKIMYLSARFYTINVLQLDPNSSSAINIPKKISNIADSQISVMNIYEEDLYTNFKTFIDGLNKILKLSNLDTQAFTDKWVHMYHHCTIFGLEMFPTFATMLTDVYVGAYINNQKTIEKIVGSRLVDFTRTIMSIGEATFN